MPEDVQESILETRGEVMALVGEIHKINCQWCGKPFFFSAGVKRPIEIAKGDFPDHVSEPYHEITCPWSACKKKIKLQYDVISLTADPFNMGFNQKFGNVISELKDLERHINYFNG